MSPRIGASILGVMLVALWQMAVAVFGVSPIILPTPLEVASASLRQLSDASFWRDAVLTLGRTLVATLIGVVVGLPIGFQLGMSRLMRNSFEPWLDFLRSIPPVLFIPVFMLLLGLGDPSKLAVAAYGATLLVALNTISGVAAADPMRQELAQMWGLTRLQRFRWILVGEAAPQVSVGIRAGATLALVLIVVSEMMIGGGGGLGQRVQEDQLLFRTPDMYSTILVTGILGYLLNNGLVWAQRKVIHWSVV